jgi:hypothetical protein
MESVLAGPGANGPTARTVPRAELGGVGNSPQAGSADTCLSTIGTEST